MGVNGYTIFGFEIQHIIPQEMFDEYGTKLAALGIKKDSVGNLMALLSNAGTAEASVGWVPTHHQHHHPTQSPESSI